MSTGKPTPPLEQSTVALVNDLERVLAVLPDRMHYERNVVGRCSARMIDLQTKIDKAEKLATPSDNIKFELLRVRKYNVALEEEIEKLKNPETCNHKKKKGEKLCHRCDTIQHQKAVIDEARKIIFRAEICSISLRELEIFQELYKAAINED